MPVLVTRPVHEAGQWVQDLRDRGVAAEALPLIAILPPPDPEALAAARKRLAQYRAVMFVSGNAVRGFLPGAAHGGPHPAWPGVGDADGPRAWAPGPGTARALGAAGVAPGRIDQPAADAAQFDSESLWATVAPQVRPGDAVLLVRGAGEDGQARGRDWLARQLAAAGARVDSVAAYARGCPTWSAAQRARALAALGDGSLWLLSSSEGVQHLAQLLPQADFGTARALATHPRIAAAARAAGFGAVHACRPALDDVAASIESFR